MSKILGIIPARGGSKGIKNKNLQLVNGKPLVLHATDTALKSAVLDRIIVNTNDDEIIDLVKSRAGIEVPFKRPEELASDTSLISEAIAHLLAWLKANDNYIPDAFMLLEPTCPLRTIADIRAAVALYEETKKACVIAVSEPLQHPSNMVTLQNDKLQYCLPRSATARGRQDFNETWFINGAVYITQTEFFNKTQRVYDLSDCALYKMPNDRAFDINTPFDLALVRAHVHSIKEEESYA